MTRRPSVKRHSDYFVIRLLRGVMTTAILVVVLGFAGIGLWVWILDADTAAKVPQPLLVLVIVGLAVTMGCHYVIRWLKPALR